MVINWTNIAKTDLYNFLLHTHKYKKQQYIEKIVTYTEILIEFPMLGKVLFHIRNLEIRQLIYEKHKIIYYINSNEIIILSVIHSSRNVNKVFENLKNLFK